MRKLQLPLSKETVKTLKAGDSVLLSGTILTARAVRTSAFWDC